MKFKRKRLFNDHLDTTKWDAQQVREREIADTVGPYSAFLADLAVLYPELLSEEVHLPLVQYGHVSAFRTQDIHKAAETIRQIKRDDEGLALVHEFYNAGAGGGHA